MTFLPAGRKDALHCPAELSYCQSASLEVVEVKVGIDVAKDPKSWMNRQYWSGLWKPIGSATHDLGQITLEELIHDGNGQRTLFMRGIAVQNP